MKVGVSGLPRSPVTQSVENEIGTGEADEIDPGPRLTGDTVDAMASDLDRLVSVRDLRNRGGDVLARVQRGETLTVTSDGTPVAELRPLPRRSRSATELVARRRTLPRVDPEALRAEVDSILDQTL